MGRMLIFLVGASDAWKKNCTFVIFSVHSCGCTKQTVPLCPAEVPRASRPPLSDQAKSAPTNKEPTRRASKAHNGKAQKASKPEVSRRRESPQTSPAAHLEQASGSPAFVLDRVPETPEPVTPPSKRLKAPGLGLTPPQQPADAKRPSVHDSDSGEEKGAELVPLEGPLKVGGEKGAKKGRKRKEPMATEALDK